MDIKRLRVGTKVKMLTDSPYYTVGATGTLTNTSCFHREGGIKDDSDHYWIFTKPLTQSALGLHTHDGLVRCCVGSETNFKVLKY